jgi:hypothetical protein
VYLWGYSAEAPFANAKRAPSGILQLAVRIERKIAMRSPQSVEALETLGRVRLSRSFYMRDFLYSEIANFHGKQNIPDNPDLAVANGTRLCEELLEPLQATFGHVSIRSAYRSSALNGFGNEMKLGCGSNEHNNAAHIWDAPDKDKKHGAMACIVLPWFADRFENGADWRALAYWIHNHLPYSELQFFPKLCAFNIGWHEVPRRVVHSYIQPSIELQHGEPPNQAYADWYQGFPPLRMK